MGSIGTTEILLVLAVVVLLFGAKKLPELARGSGRALRIFKSEVRGLEEDDKRHQASRSEATEPEAIDPVEVDKKTDRP